MPTIKKLSTKRGFNDIYGTDDDKIMKGAKSMKTAFKLRQKSIRVKMHEI